VSDYVQKDGSGNLFKNDRKQKDSHPDYRGTITIEGTQYELAAWLKDGKKGKYMSLNAKIPQPRDNDAPRERQAAADNFGDSEIPF
jgi:hypothetical protein